jgi:hypothetical protein
MTNNDDAPKSSLELAMERLKRKDAETGVSDVPLTDEKRQEISEVRKVYEARFAEREILHHAARRKAKDEETLKNLEDEYRRDRERLTSERDRKIEQIRARPS